MGSNSALAAHGRYPTAQVVHQNTSYFLIDCGEGTQMQMSKFRVKRSKIEQIFISHLHGDHYFGLIGLLTSYQLMGRTLPLTIFAPHPLENIINAQLNASNTTLNYPLTFKSTKAEGKNLLFENDTLCVYSFPLKHRIPTTGFLFEEKEQSRRVDGEKTKALDLTPLNYKAILKGEDITINGKKYTSEELTLEPYQPRSYAFCSDTCYLPELKNHIHQVDLLYHEATFMKGAEEKATKTYHTTTEQAGEIAKIVEAKKLLIGHFSSKYIDLAEPLAETKSVFPNTQLAIEGETFEILRDKKS